MDARCPLMAGSGPTAFRPRIETAAVQDASCSRSGCADRCELSAKSWNAVNLPLRDSPNLRLPSDTNPGALLSAISLSAGPCCMTPQPL